MNLIHHLKSLAILLSVVAPADSFQSSHHHRYQHLFCLNDRNNGCRASKSALWVSRYGPPITPPGSSDEEEKEFEAADLRAKEKWETDLINLVGKILTAKDPAHIPSLLTKHIEMLLSMQQEQTAVEMVETVLKETSLNFEEEQVLAAMDIILSFTEDFVKNANEIDLQNKRLLGYIIRVMADKETSEREREDELDKLLEEERANFTPGFLRHIEGECERLASARKITQDSFRMIDILRTIQTRVVEEMGKDLGEGALVLGQLIAYDDSRERLAVLDAGLLVRGIGFARELLSLTEEALEGFQNVPGGAEKDLIERVASIHRRVKEYITQKQQRNRNEFQ